jgi:hypothetical protein
MADNTTTLGDSAGTDGFGFIDESVAVGLTIFDNVYSAVTGRAPTPVTLTTPAAQAAAKAQQTGQILMFAVLGIGVYLLMRR